jgi:hypothetical protein
MKFVGALAAIIVLGTVSAQSDCGPRGCGDDELHDDWRVYRDRRVAPLESRPLLPHGERCSRDSGGRLVCY